MQPASAAALSLLSAQTVRERAHRLLELGLKGELEHFRVSLSKLEGAADLVIEGTRAAYPTLDVPFHSRWRHFVVNGTDRWQRVAAEGNWRDPAERARAAFDLAMVSVLLDAGAGPDWTYLDWGTGARIGRSEGLALASLVMFVVGTFSADPDRDSLRADASGLLDTTTEALNRCFQVDAANPLLGAEGRVALLQRLGAVVAAAPDVFATADRPRPGGLFDYLAANAARDRAIAAPDVLAAVLRHLGPMWPSRLELDGVPLGDCWRHPALTTDDASSGLMPLHKLSQWLTYSLLEPLQEAGFTVRDINGLTGLAEYRNGGLLIDTGVLALRDPAAATRPHEPGSTLVVEWRALTVALLDRLADIMRERLGMDAETLPLAKVLQGGTWTAGRQIAGRLRPDGGPPLTIVSDGTVF